MRLPSEFSSTPRLTLTREEMVSSTLRVTLRREEALVDARLTWTREEAANSRLSERWGVGEVGGVSLTGSLKKRDFFPAALTGT
jgi:hypothetical protein